MVQSRSASDGLSWTLDPQPWTLDPLIRLGVSGGFLRFWRRFLRRRRLLRLIVRSRRFVLHSAAVGRRSTARGRRMAAGHARRATPDDRPTTLMHRPAAVVLNRSTAMVHRHRPTTVMHRPAAVMHFGLPAAAAVIVVAAKQAAQQPGLNRLVPAGQQNDGRSQNLIAQYLANHIFLPNSVKIPVNRQSMVPTTRPVSRTERTPSRLKIAPNGQNEWTAK